MQRRRRRTQAASHADMASLALGSGFAPVALVPGILVSVGGVANLVNPGLDRHGGLNGANSLVAGSMLLLIGLLHWRSRIPGRLLPYAPGAIAVILTLQSAIRLLLTGSPLVTTLMVVALLSTGATVPRLWPLLLAQLISLVAFVAALGVWGPGVGPWREMAGVLVLGELVSSCLYMHHSLGNRKLVALTEAIGRQASRDHLTGLLNRRGMQFSIDALMLSETSTVCLGAIWLDVDGFKSINDQLGHGVGDSVLITIAQRLGTLVRSEDLVIRVGGDEFLVLLTSVDAASLADAAHRAQQQLTGTAGATNLSWSVSVGTALGPVSSEADVDALLRTADMAMFADKSRHRTTFGRTALNHNVR